MSKFKKVKIGDFLTEREGRYKPNNESVANLKRLEKIDFSGTVHISEKPSKTDMIIVHPGDLVISGINVSKGAITVYKGSEPVAATIHYSSYIFNDSIVDLDYFKFFVKSPAFIETLKQQVKGGIKTEIKPKTFLLLEIMLPDLETQKGIVKKLSKELETVSILQNEIESQKEYTKQLRKNILQDAIEGKLTADWRAQHPVIKGNPDYDAEALFEKIQKGKENSKKEKLQDPIFTEELNIPSNWKYPSLFEITKQITDGTHMTPNYVENGEVFLSAQNVKPFQFIPENHKFVSKADFDTYRNNRTPEINDILMARVGAGIGEAAVIDQSLEFAFYVSLCLIKTFSEYTNPNYLVCVLNSAYGTNYSKNNISSTGSSAGNYNLGHIRSLKIPFPPLAEQNEIVNVIESQFDKVDKLELQIQERETYTKQLMQSILKNAFEEE